MVLCEKWARLQYGFTCSLDTRLGDPVLVVITSELEIALNQSFQQPSWNLQQKWLLKLTLTCTIWILSYHAHNWSCKEGICAISYVSQLLRLSCTSSIVGLLCYHINWGIRTSWTFLSTLNQSFVLELVIMLRLHTATFASNLLFLRPY